MNKIILLILSSILGMTQSVAQEYEYIPFVREGVKWVYVSRYADVDGIHYPFLTLELKGDTVIDGKSYKIMHKYYGDDINWEYDTVPVCLREENKVVYGIVPDGRTFEDCPIGVFTDAEMMDKIYNGQEFVLYDFNDPIPFINGIEVELDDDGAFVEQMLDVIPTTSTIAGKKVNKYIFGFDSGLCLIEGIGFDGEVYGYTLSVSKAGNPQHLSHVIENGVEIYRSERYKLRPEDDQYLSLVREGVQWVNEREIVYQGDTIQYYYKYEFKGTYGTLHHPNCYYYTGESLDSSDNAMLAARASVGGYEMAAVNRGISFYGNLPLDKVFDEGREMVMCKLFDPIRYRLYSFSRLESDICLDYTPNFFILHQLEPFLTRENFVEVEPINIEGIKCDRFAYIGEDGDTLAYVVEGIGFDSRDMGDLLTPFTRKPDPNADYQEWCGLSHVVKDGKIIYKGMRWRDGAFEGIDEVVADKSPRLLDPNYYNLMGQPVGKEVPTAPGIYIHQGKKIIVR